jgi:hypothetical protein
LRYSIVIFAALLFWSCASVPAVTAPSAPLEPRDFPVLRVILNDVSLACLRRDPARILLVEDSTSLSAWNGSTGAAVHYGSPEDWSVDVTSHLETRNRSAFDLGSLEPLPEGAQLASSAAIRSALGRKGDWSRFRRVCPSAYGVATVSAPGFSTDSTRVGAVVSVYCGLLCGWGELVLLENFGGEWKIVKRYPLWES